MERFEMYIDYKKLYANELGDTLLKLNEFYSLCEILLYEKGESNRLRRLVRELGNPNLEIDYFERGSLKGFLKANLTTIALVLAILSDGSNVGGTVITQVDHLIKSLGQNEQEDINNLRQNETVIDAAKSFIKTVQDNPNLGNTSFIYEHKDKEAETKIIIDMKFKENNSN